MLWSFGVSSILAQCTGQQVLGGSGRGLGVHCSVSGSPVLGSLGMAVEVTA